MITQSKAFLIALCLELVSRSTTNAFVSPFAAPTVASVRSRKHNNLNMIEGLTEPISALIQDASVVPQLVQQLSQTLFFPAVDTPSTAQLIQTAGEASFAGMLGIAAMQGAMVMKQYQTNPDGGLIIPPGLTVGDEDATNPHYKVSRVVEKSSRSSFGFRKNLSDLQVEEMVCDTEDTPLTCAMKKGWYHATTQVAAFALIPLAAFAGPSWGLAAWMMRYGHIMHLAAVFGLTHIYDFFRKLPTMETYCDASKTKCELPTEVDEPIFEGDHPRIMVLGDSMCVGIGTCEVFDDKKIYDIPLHKEEHLPSTEEELQSSALPGPVFPSVLARTLSKRFQKPVAWRSAGVDGGATQDIAEHLLSVVQDEVDKGQAPDLVVVLTGSNDLKHLLDGSASVKGFRSNLMSLAQEIRNISPKTKVVFPALPTYRMDQKSVLNVFPLSIFLDSFMGVWDAQKKVAAEHPGVMHVDLTVADVNKWYEVDESEGAASEDISLISADGIHPNARCYKKWGEFVGNDLADQIMGNQQPMVMKAQDDYSPTYGGGFSFPHAFGVAKQHQ